MSDSIPCSGKKTTEDFLNFAKKDIWGPFGRPNIRFENLLFHDLQDFHGAGLDTDAAGDALGNGALGLQHHDLHGANLNALAAADAGLLIDHVHAGLLVLGDGTVLADLSALTALDADIGLCTGALGHNLNAAQIGVEFLIKSSRAGTDTFQAGHALGTFFN